MDNNWLFNYYFFGQNGFCSINFNEKLFYSVKHLTTNNYTYMPLYDLIRFDILP